VGFEPTISAGERQGRVYRDTFIDVLEEFAASIFMVQAVQVGCYMEYSCLWRCVCDVL